MALPEASPSEHWIIGYGNAQRRDDGLGPYIVSRLQPVFADRSDVHLRASHQLEPDLVEWLKSANTVLFVDAAMGAVAAGRRWMAVLPERSIPSCLGHRFSPAFIIGWLQCLYRRCPAAWLVSVEGSDFGFGSGLSSGARKRAGQVAGEITAFIMAQGMNKAGTPGQTGKRDGFGQH